MLRRGQALVMLLVFVAVSTVIISAAVVLAIIGSTSASQFTNGIEAWATAESGAENALIMLLRNPNYSGETLTLGSNTATITVVGTDPKIITSVGTAGEFTRTIQVTTGNGSGILTIASWQEIF